MKRLIFAIAMMAVAMTACTSEDNRPNTTIEGRFVGNEVDSVFLERINDAMLAPERIEAQALADNGAFKFDFSVEEGTSPRFYRLSFGEEVRPVTLVVAPGDNIKLESIGDIFLNYTVEGSEESALVRDFCHSYFAAADRLSSIVEIITNSEDEEIATSWNLEAYRAAEQAIQAQVRFVGSHRGSLAAFFAIRHSVAEQYIPQLSGAGINIIHYQTVLEGLRERYPDSPYIAILEREITDAEILFALSQNATMMSYPEITLEDMYHVEHSLSSLDGNVVLLCFWSANVAACNALNANLKSIYERYHDEGFEVYMVSADRSEALWIEAVRAQGHPWISVFGGNNPEVLTLYNVASYPQAYLIDREGDISIPSLLPEQLEAAIEAVL